MARRPARIAPYTSLELRRDLWREPRLPDPAAHHRVTVLVLALALVGLPLLLCELAALEQKLAPLRFLQARLAP